MKTNMKWRALHLTEVVAGERGVCIACRIGAGMSDHRFRISDFMSGQSMEILAKALTAEVKRQRERDARMKRYQAIGRKVANRMLASTKGGGK